MPPGLCMNQATFALNVTNRSLINLLNDIRLNLKVPIHIHQAIDFLLNVRNLCIAVAADIRKLFDGGGHTVKAADEILFGVYLVAISPSGVIVIEGDSAELAEDHRLSFVFESFCKSRTMAVVEDISA